MYLILRKLKNGISIYLKNIWKLKLYLRPSAQSQRKTIIGNQRHSSTWRTFQFFCSTIGKVTKKRTGLSTFGQATRSRDIRFCKESTYDFVQSENLMQILNERNSLKLYKLASHKNRKTTNFTHQPSRNLRSDARTLEFQRQSTF